jgi:hypothetical protein
MTVEKFWQFTRADGDPNWPTGAETFQHIWNRAFELLKFERGDGFTIENRKTGDVAPKRTLREIHDPLKGQMDENPEVTFIVRSLRTAAALAFRLHAVELKTRGEQFLNIGRELIGTPYDLGGVGQAGVDCSGLVMYESNPFDIGWGPFYTNRAQVMWDEARKEVEGKAIISREKVLPGDLLIIHDGDHVATYLDDRSGGRVLDAQPSGVQSPWGWTPGGVQVRSMSGNYYCAWQNVNAVVRLVRINGKP